MKITFTHHDQIIELTTEHATSSYGIPVVLINGNITDIQVDCKWDDTVVPSPLAARYKQTIGYYPHTISTLESIHGARANNLLDGIISEFEDIRRNNNIS